MIIIKSITLLSIFLITFLIGHLISKKYTSRVAELKELQIAFDILENKIKFTYEPLREIFLQMKGMLKDNIAIIFDSIAGNMQDKNVEESFQEALRKVKTNLLEEDKEILKNLSKSLGKTEKEGQVSQIELAQTFLKSQIKKAEKESEKNAKLYKTLGITVGLAFVIVLL